MDLPNEQPTNESENTMKHTLKTLERTGISWEAVLGMTTAEAKMLWIAHRISHGLSGVAVPLLTDPDGNQKLAKDKVGWLAWSFSGAPHRTGGTNMCPASTKACRKHCVSFAGKGGLTTVQAARNCRTSFLMTQPVAFMRLLVGEIDKAVIKCEGLDVGMAMRLNAFTDVAWERVVPWLFEMFDTVRFYDYTKRMDREDLPLNYTVTLSATERWNTNRTHLQRALRDTNVAVIFDTPRTQDLPATYYGTPVVDGDKSDLRFKDPDAVIVGLRSKGTLRRDNSLGFAVHVGEY